MPVEVKRAGSRVYERLDWLHAWHCLTGPAYVRGTDSHFGVLVNHDHGIVSAGTGFGTHYHRNMEIVTWVLDGSLVHQDTRGHSGLIHPGLAQRMTAGAGILHSERNDSWVLDGPRHERDVEMVQMWVVPDAAGVTLQPGASVHLPAAPWVHLYVPRGSVDVEGVGLLSTGDAARCTDEPGRRVTAREASEVLVWEMLTSL